MTNCGSVMEMSGVYGGLEAGTSGANITWWVKVCSTQEAARRIMWLE